jgi:hypothetical protein
MSISWIGADRARLGLRPCSVEVRYRTAGESRRGHETGRVDFRKSSNDPGPRLSILGGRTSGKTDSCRLLRKAAFRTDSVAVANDPHTRNQFGINRRLTGRPNTAGIRSGRGIGPRLAEDGLLEPIHLD